MRTGISLLVAFLLVACLVVPAASAQTVMFIGAGSSAMWQEFALAAVNDPTLNGPGSHHWTTSGVCPDGSNCAQAFDSRSGPGGTVDDHQGGNLWVVWNKAETRVWAYLSVDSVVGNRLFFATPRATLQIDSNALNEGSGGDLISPSLFKYGAATTSARCAGASTCDDSALPAKILDAILAAPTITAAMTDIRPEDALFASNRVNCPPPITLGCLGYGISGNPVANPVLSAFTTSKATPVAYAISGDDPVSGEAVPAWTTFPVGAQPIVILVNRSDASGLGQKTTAGAFAITNVTHAQLQTIFSGANCNTSALGAATAHAIFPVLREPLSGTMNTFEFTNMTSPTSLVNSQETKVLAHNPLNNACAAGGGKRFRGIGTGQITGAILNGNQNATTGAYPIPSFKGADGIGYAFFSYGNVSHLTNPTWYGYLTLDGVDPLLGNPGHVANGGLPACKLPCPAAPNTTFKNLRNGTYRSFSFVRLVTEKTGNENAAELVKAAQASINLYVPDFVPYVAAGGDAGMKFYRSHFPVTVNGVTYAAKNGLPFKDASAESGGDVGGCIEPVTENVLGEHENVTGGCAK
ncbi:MAG TPA: hypothetical protein VEI52_15890 [Terriglobales bacterium]|nr:hypothetical protein [Terriglobales bacterium]